MKRIILCVLLLAGLLPLLGTTPRESDDYAYIVELYDAGEYQECLFEIEYFVMRYQESEFLPYLDYIRANIAFSRQDHSLAQSIYSRLAQMPLHTDVLSDIHLNYAISLYQTKGYNQAVSILSTLNLFSTNPYYKHKSTEWLGRIFAAQGNYLSAKHEYEKAMADSTGDMGIVQEYFQLLLDMSEDDIAINVMENASADSTLYCRFTRKWMEYLLINQRFEELDTLYPKADSLCGEFREEVDMIMVRRYIASSDYSKAGEFLEAVDSPSDYRIYYQALILKEQGYTTQADSLFQELVRGRIPEIQFLSYLQRLKIVYDRDPETAINSLKAYIESKDNIVYKGEQHFLLGYFYFGKQRYTEALLQFTKAMGYDLPFEMRDQAENYISESYYLVGELRLARERYNRYLNMYPYGRYRDKALFQTGIISFNEPDLVLAKSYLTMLVQLHSDSEYVDRAMYLLGEIAFSNSHYEDAVRYFSAVPIEDRNHHVSRLRTAHSLINLDRYPEADSVLVSIPVAQRDYEWQILNATLAFNTRNYELALAGFQSAGQVASGSQQRIEATSFKAYTLYYMKRFDEASNLFSSISELAPASETYLYQAAKSAYQGRNYKRALDLYDRFIDEFQDSPHFISVLVEVAYCYYNLGLYEESYNDWMNILKRFTAHEYLDDKDLPLVREALNGLELACGYLDSQTVVNDISELSTLFRSDYIAFELQYLVVRLYADNEQWQSLIDEAEEIRKAFPDMKRTEIELLMAESLLKLNATGEADSLVTTLYEETQSVESLIKLAELSTATGDAAIALQYYGKAFEQQESANTWLSMLSVSVNNNYLDFDNVWDIGRNYSSIYPQARLHRMKYLIGLGFRQEARGMANQILDTELNQYYRAEAELTLAQILYEEGDYPKAVQSFKRIRMLFREYQDVLSTANYYYILSLIQSGSLKEAQLTLWDVQNTLSDDQIIIINDLLDTKR